ncbi:MAG: hypothetical protein ABIJ27_05465 [Candidatus Omnitrophota bacterium]
MIQEIKLPFRLKRPMLALGGDLKGAYALARGSKAFLVGEFGDLAELDNFLRYRESIRKHMRSLGIDPTLAVSDMHPGYMSTKFGEEWSGGSKRRSVLKIQHHQAHCAACMADNGISGKSICVSFDGTGYGSDGNVWGGEFFLYDGKTFKRAAYLMNMRMPGSESAIREPWRMAVSYLREAFGKQYRKLNIKLIRTMIKKRERDAVEHMLDTGLNSPMTSSAGRLFDAVGAMVLPMRKITYEAEAPIELEKLTDTMIEGSYEFQIRREGGVCVVDTLPVIRGVVNDLSRNAPKPRVATKFHNTVAAVIRAVCVDLARSHRVTNVFLSGGVFLNAYLLAASKDALTGEKLNVRAHSRVSTSDYGLPLGQLAIAAAVS